MTPIVRRVARLLAVSAFAVCGLLAAPSRADAQVEATGVIGGLIGGDLRDVRFGDLLIKAAFDSGPVYGARVGFIGGLFGVEGSYVVTPSGVSLSIPAASVNGSMSFLEANVLFVPIPGPISPFATAGVGLHSYRLDFNAGDVTVLEDDFSKFGWNFGGGLKINIKGLTLRADVRDHITTVGPDDLNLGSIAAALGLRESTVHNIEISGGVGIRF